jgi:PilZ domain
MVEHRRARRKGSLSAIQVINSITAEPIGQIGNLSVDGMLLIANRALPDGALFQLNFALPGHAGGAERRLEIGVHEQWSEAASIPGQYWVGFRIIDIDTQDRTALGAWINAH